MDRIDRERDRSGDRPRAKDAKENERRRRHSSEDADKTARRHNRDYGRKSSRYAREKEERRRSPSSEDTSRRKKYRDGKGNGGRDRKSAKYAQEKEERRRHRHKEHKSERERYREREADRGKKPAKYVKEGEERKRRRSSGEDRSDSEDNRYTEKHGSRDRSARIQKKDECRSRRRDRSSSLSSSDDEESQGSAVSKIKRRKSESRNSEWIRKRNDLSDTTKDTDWDNFQENGRRSSEDRNESDRDRSVKIDRDHGRRPVRHVQEVEEHTRRRSNRSSSRSSLESAVVRRRGSESREAEWIRKSDHSPDSTSKDDHSTDSKTKDWRNEEREVAYGREKADVTLTEHMKKCEIEAKRMGDQGLEDSERAGRLKEFLENCNDLRHDGQGEEMTEPSKNMLGSQVNLCVHSLTESSLKEEGTSVAQISGLRDFIQNEEAQVSLTSELKQAIEIISTEMDEDVKRSTHLPSGSGKSPMNDSVELQTNTVPTQFMSSVVSNPSNPQTMCNLNDLANRNASIAEVCINALDNRESGPSNKRKRKPSDDDVEERIQTSSVSHVAEKDKRRLARDLINKIPIGEELFSYSVDWTLLDDILMEKRIRPYIKKQVVEYVGKEVPVLVEFLCWKVMSRSGAQSILEDLKSALDEEAEVFVMKIWRLLIYEVEARKLGIGDIPRRRS